jgi:hypothetical protein
MPNGILAEDVSSPHATSLLQAAGSGRFWLQHPVCAYVHVDSKYMHA